MNIYIRMSALLLIPGLLLCIHSMHAQEDGPDAAVPIVESAGGPESAAPAPDFGALPMPGDAPIGPAPVELPSDQPATPAPIEMPTETTATAPDAVTDMPAFTPISGEPAQAEPAAAPEPADTATTPATDQTPTGETPAAVDAAPALDASTDTGVTPAAAVTETPAAPVFEIERSLTGTPPATAPEQVAPPAPKKRSLWSRLFGRRPKAEPEAAQEPAPAKVEEAAAGGPAADAAQEAVAAATEPMTPEAMLAAQEEVRRQALEVEGMQNFKQGMEAMSRNEFAEALKSFSKALDLLPRRPHTVELRNQARMHQAECEYRLGMNYYKDGNLTEARLALRRALGYYPNHARAMRLLDRIQSDEKRRQEIATRPVHLRNAPEHKAMVKDIRAALERGNQYMSINEFEKAEQEFQSVLQAEPLNSDAAAQLQRLAERRYRKETEQMSRFQAEMITKVRDTWTPPIKRTVTQRREIDGEEGGADPTRRRRLLEKLNNIMIPQLDFRQANIHDVIKYIDQQAQAVDKDSPPDQRGVNIVLNMQRPGMSAAAPSAISPLEADPFATPVETGMGQAGVPTVTLTLRNVVLLDAIKFITEMTGLKYRIESDVVVITPADVVVGEVMTRTYKVQPGVISEHILSAAPSGGGGGGGLFDLGAPAAPAGGGGDIKQFFVEAGVPFPEGTAIVYKPSLNLMIVSNTGENLEKFERILGMLNVVPIQVEIEARFVEVAQSDLEELGIEWLLNDNWVIAQNSGANASLPVSARERVQINKNNMTKGLRFFDGVGETMSAVQSGGAAGILSISSVLTSPQLSVILHALQQRSGVNLLSAPKVTTRTGSNAEIKVVRELIYPTDYEITPAQTLGTTGAQSFSPPFVTPTGFEQRDLGVVLNVTPTVGPDNFTIDLIMLPQVVELQEWMNYGSPMPDGRGNFIDMVLKQPIFHSRTIATSISIWDGQTVVMGGLITEGQQTSEDKVPFLGDIPLLGYLFRSKTNKSIKRNLLIFVTAYLVDPAGNRINKDSGVPTPAAPEPAATP